MALFSAIQFHYLVQVCFGQSFNGSRLLQIVQNFLSVLAQTVVKHWQVEVKSSQHSETYC